MRILWGRANSGNVMKLVWLLEELNIPYERREAGGNKGRLDTPEFTALNPNQLIPVLQEGDFILWESNAILRYLAVTQPGGEAFYPPDPRARADIDRWLDWQQTALAASFGRLFYMVARTPPDRQKPRLIERVAANAGRHWGMLENILTSAGGITGSTLSLADFAIGPQLHRWFTLPITRPALPKLQAWHERLLARPAYRAHATVGGAPLASARARGGDDVED